MDCQLPEDDGKISILEKVSRLTEIFDPNIMPIDLIQFYASNLGYAVGLNRDEINTTYATIADPLVAAASHNKYLRFMVSQLPEWYKAKTSRPSVQVMLYSFGLVGDLVYYYTTNYLNDVVARDANILIENVEQQKFFDSLSKGSYASYKEIYTELCKLKYNVDLFRKSVKSNWRLTDWDGSSIKENPMNIPDDYFPTPHFKLWFDVLESMSSLTYSVDLARHSQMTTAINSIRPINTVFEGIAAAMTIKVNMYRVPYIRVIKNISIVSDVPSDQWAVT